MDNQTPSSSSQRRPRRRKPRQTKLRFRTWGGKREGAGRKKVRPGAVSHAARPPLASRYPVHVSYKVAGDLPSLRQPDLLQLIEGCLGEIAEKAEKEGADFRAAHYSIQREHLHLIVEAHNRKALTRGLKGLAGRIAKRINKLLERKGAVFVDRYFERILRTPKQTRHCLLYVLNNARRHAAQAGMVCARGWLDPCSSAASFDGWREPVSAQTEAGLDPPVSRPHTWLLSAGWRRHGLLAVDAVPGGA
jgi:REP element-mobilizing transposase RayT